MIVNYKLINVLGLNGLAIGLWLTDHSAEIVCISAILAGIYTIFQLYDWVKNKFGK